MEMTYTTEFACTPEQLWPYLEQPEKQKLWMKGLLENEMVSGEPNAVGSRFRMKIKEGRKVSEYDGELLVHDEPRRIGIKMWGGCMQAGSECFCHYDLTDLGGRTRLDYEMRMEGMQGFFMKLMMPVFRMFGMMQLKGFMKTLHKLVEEPQSQPSA